MCLIGLVIGASKPHFRVPGRLSFNKRRNMVRRGRTRALLVAIESDYGLSD